MPPEVDQPAPQPQHRVAPDTMPTDQEYSTWSFAEKREYTTTGKWPQRPRTAA